MATAGCTTRRPAIWPARNPSRPKTPKPVAEVFRRFAAGETLYRIAEDLNGRGLLPPPTRMHGEVVQRPWDGSRLHRMVRNPAYVAKRVHQGRIVTDGQWPALIDVATFERANARLDDPARTMNRDRRDVAHLLTGIARCGICGEAVPGP